MKAQEMNGERKGKQQKGKGWKEKVKQQRGKLKQ